MPMNRSELFTGNNPLLDISKPLKDNYESFML